jgi:hypothetical protein
MDEDLLAFENANIEFEDYSDVTFESSEKNKGTILWDGLFDILETNMLSSVKMFLKHCALYIDRNTDALAISAPYERLLFLETRDSDPLFTIFHITKKQVKDVVKKSPLIYETFRTLNDPLIILLTALNQFYRNYPGNRDAIAAVNYSSLFLALRFYSSRQGHLWPYGAHKDIMEYTVNHITDKFLMRKHKTIIGVLQYISTENDNNLGIKLFETHIDADFKYYITNFKTRINNFLRNIWVEYDKNVKNQNYIGETSDRYDDEDQNLRELDNASSEIYQSVFKIYGKVKSSPIDMAILKDAVTGSNLSSNTVLNTLESIIKNETDTLKTVITSTIQMFLKEPKNKIAMLKSKYFMVYAMKVYRVSNTIDKDLQALKNQLDDWIKQYGSTYVKLNRAATLSTFRKCVFQYIVGCIIKYS